MQLKKILTMADVNGSDGDDLLANFYACWGVVVIVVTTEVTTQCTTLLADSVNGCLNGGSH